MSRSSKVLFLLTFLVLLLVMVLVQSKSSLRRIKGLMSRTTTTALVVPTTNQKNLNNHKTNSSSSLKTLPWRSQQNPARDFPHAGARRWSLSSSNGNSNSSTLGWIIDPSPRRMTAVNVTALRLEYPSMCVGNGKEEAPLEGAGGAVVFRQKLLPAFSELQQQQQENNPPNPKRILCLVYTVHLPEAGKPQQQQSATQPQSTNTQQQHYTNPSLQAISQTWGQRCDGFIGASNFTDHTMGSVDLPHQGPEAYKNMWQKIRSMWAYAYDNYLDEYDYFHIGGDDMYLNVDQLRAFLQGPQVRRLEHEGYLDRISNWTNFRPKAARWRNVRPRPLYFGTPMNFRRSIYPSGGPGYTLNRAALKLFGEKGLDTFLWNATDPREDVFMGGFFDGMGVILSDAQDDKDCWLYSGTAESGHNYKPNGPTPMGTKQLRARFGYNFDKGGIDAVSAQQISFHLKDDKKRLAQRNWSIADLMRRYHALFYGWCPGER